MRANPRNIRFDDLAKVCVHHFGPPKTFGGSHLVFFDVPRWIENDLRHAAIPLAGIPVPTRL